MRHACFMLSEYLLLLKLVFSLVLRATLYTSILTLKICWAWNTSWKDLSLILEFFHWDWDLPNRTYAFAFIFFFKLLHDHLLNIFMIWSLHDIFISPSKLFHELITLWNLHITSELHHFFILHHLFETQDQYLTLGSQHSSSCSSNKIYFPSWRTSKQKTTMRHAYFSEKQNIIHLQKEETKCIIFKIFTFSLSDVEIRWCMKT